MGSLPSLRAVHSLVRQGTSEYSVHSKLTGWKDKRVSTQAESRVWVNEMRNFVTAKFISAATRPAVPDC